MRREGRKERGYEKKARRGRDPSAGIRTGRTYMNIMKEIEKRG